MWSALLSVTVISHLCKGNFTSFNTTMQSVHTGEGKEMFLVAAYLTVFFLAFVYFRLGGSLGVDINVCDNLL